MSIQKQKTELKKAHSTSVQWPWFSNSNLIIYIFERMKNREFFFCVSLSAVVIVCWNWHVPLFLKCVFFCILCFSFLFFLLDQNYWKINLYIPIGKWPSSVSQRRINIPALAFDSNSIIRLGFCIVLLSHCITFSVYTIWNLQK